MYFTIIDRFHAFLVTYNQNVREPFDKFATFFRKQLQKYKTTSLKHFCLFSVNIFQSIDATCACHNSSPF